MSGHNPIGIFASDRAIGEGGVPYLEALQSDVERYNNHPEPSALDWYIVDNCLTDNMLSWRLTHFADGEKVSRFNPNRKDYNQKVAARQAEISELTDINTQAIDQNGIDANIEMVSANTTKRVRSDLYPGYSQSLFELFSRKSVSAVFLPFYRRIIESRNRSILDVQPTHEDMSQFYTNAMSSILTLSHLIEIADATQATKETLEGFINEVDTIGQIAMGQGVASLQGELKPTELDGSIYMPTSWILPAPFIDDVAGERIDAQELTVNLTSGDLVCGYIDVKRGKGGKNTTFARTGLSNSLAQRINAHTVGNIDDSGKIVPGHKAMVSYDHLATNSLADGGTMFLDMFPEMTIDRLYARGFAQAGINLQDPIRV